MAHIETNPLVLSGEYVRVYVVELEPGDVNTFGNTVKRVNRFSDVTTSVEWADDTATYYGHADSTILIKS